MPRVRTLGPTNAFANRATVKVYSGIDDGSAGQLAATGGYRRSLDTLQHLLSDCAHHEWN